MQQIARELKGFVSEVIYLFPEDDRYFLKYYSSECEVDFCGHGTIAIMYDFIKNDPQLINQPEVTIRVKEECLLIKNQILHDNAIYISAPLPQYLETDLNVSEISLALQIPDSHINSNYQVGFVNGGLRTLIVPVKHLQECLEINPDQFALRDFCLKNNIDIILVFTDETAKTNTHYRTRVFAPKFGYLEDPATGSGNSAFGYYLLKENRWNGGKLMFEQSQNRDNPNFVNLCTSEIDGKTRLLFGGGAIVRIQGEYQLCNLL